MAETSPCPGCAAPLQPSDGPAHAYINASPACWEIFGRLMARWSGDLRSAADVNQLAVDAFAAQHPGGAHPDKSVDVHLVGLHLALERELPAAEVVRAYQRLIPRVAGWPHLVPPWERGTITVADVARASSPEEYRERTRAWATAVWNAWSSNHPAIRSLAEQAFQGA